MSTKTIAVTDDQKKRFDEWQWISRSKSHDEALEKLLNKAGILPAAQIVTKEEEE